MKYSISILKHSDSGKSAFCKVSVAMGPFVSEKGVGYLYVAEGQELPAVGTTFPWDGAVSFADMVDIETGEVRQTKGGVPLQRIVLG